MRKFLRTIPSPVVCLHLAESATMQSRGLGGGGGTHTAGETDARVCVRERDCGCICTRKCFASKRPTKRFNCLEGKRERAVINTCCFSVIGCVYKALHTSYMSCISCKLPYYHGHSIDDKTLGARVSIWKCKMPVKALIANAKNANPKIKQIKKILQHNHSVEKSYI